MLWQPFPGWYVLLDPANDASCSEPESVHGHSRALQGFVTALSGNITLLAYFIDQGEKGAAAIQAIGAVSNYAVLSQVRSCRSDPWQ